MNLYHPYTIFPLGDSALTIDFGNVIDESINKKVIKLFHQIEKVSHPHIIDLVPAYSSLTVYYDVAALYKEDETAFETMCEIIEEIAAQKPAEEEKKFNLIEIPVCYSKTFALDIHQIAAEKNLSVEDIIQIHTSKTYRVYMLGFLPGFAYMGEVDERIAFPRKQTPTKVFAGAVGIAGKQTGIYPFESPGGWQLIGRTPMQLFNKNSK